MFVTVDTVLILSLYDNNPFHCRACGRSDEWSMLQKSSRQGDTTDTCQIK